MSAVLIAVVASLVVLGAQDDATELAAKAKAALSQTAGEIALAGLQQPVEVIRDRWGVAHIYAKTEHDLFFAQGFVAAQDRLWQLDLWRRIADGRLAEVLGPSGVTRDTFARLLRYRSDPAAEWRSYRPDAKAIVEAFVAGINAQIDIAVSQPGKLPIEFQLTGSRPEHWTREVVIGRMAGYFMTRNARTEVQRARQALAAGVMTGRLPDLSALDPPTRVTVPDGLDLADITNDILAVTVGSSESVDFAPLKPRQPADAPGVFGFSRPRGGAAAAAKGAEDAGIGNDAGDDPFWRNGSNDWVISGALSATGKPLLANDPHRAILLPSLRYTVHLNAPGWNVIGAGEPALPGIAAGHNERIAFGFTIVGMDQQDVYVEHLDPANPDRYLFKGQSEAMRVEREQIAVRGEAPREVELRFTRHGPVLHRDLTRGRAYVLRWVGADPGGAGYLRSLALDTSRTWPEFLAALDGWRVPSENVVYADVDGNIGWVAAGAAPVRPNWNGLLPVPGHEGKYEWQGYLRVADLPHLHNPSSGFIATANHNILPPNYDKVLGYEFGNAYRFTRILEVLSQAGQEGRKLGVADFERLQHDERSIVARAMCQALAAVVARSTLPPGDAGRSASMLTRWDGTLGKESAAAALFEIWLPRLTRAASASPPLAPTERGTTADRMTTDRLLALLETSGLLSQPAVATAWVDGSVRPGHAAVALDKDAADRVSHALADILTGPALADAWRDAVSQMGPDPATWAWGRIHHAAIDHPLAFTQARRQVMNLPEVPRGGDATTPNATGSGARQTAGASYREIIDVGDWDRSMTINVPGMSGQPGSPHYGDLLSLWAAGQYHQMAFSRQAVEKAAESRLRLVPAATPPRSRTQ